MASPVAIHEAAHAVVAHRLGLTVRRVQLDGWLRVPRYCAQLYPGIVAGMPLKSSICLLESDCLDTNPGEVLIAMAAPSYVKTDDRKLNTYASLEATLAFRYARKVGISSNRVLDLALHHTADAEEEIYDLASRLDQRRVIDGRDLWAA